MTKEAIKNIKRSVFSLIILLLAFLFIVDGLLISDKTKLLYSLEHAHAEHEIKLFSRLVSGFLTKGDYASVELSAKQWGSEQNEILELTISVANGFVIVNYKKDKPDTESKMYTGHLLYGVDNSATILIKKDMSFIRHELNSLIYPLVILSIFLIALLGYSLQRIAVKPLQVEIEKQTITEESLREHTIELEAINKELESFSYSLSHDLRSPLRAITSFSQILKEETASKLDKEELHYLDRIIEGGKYMAELIESMLELARLSRVKITSSTVDLSELAHAAIERICLEDEKQNVKLLIQDDLKVNGSKVLLSILIENLLGNAYKFSRNVEKPSIEVGSLKQDGELIYYVRDNGAGFDMNYISKLFKPFQRLHRVEDYPGTGIGLATVTRIIQRHGGRVWAESKKGKGATFYFTLEAMSESQVDES